LFLTVWDIYGATFKDILPAVHDLGSGEAKKPDANLTAESKGNSKTP
jgi:hypothetical protein